MTKLLTALVLWLHLTLGVVLSKSLFGFHSFYLARGFFWEIKIVFSITKLLTALAWNSLLVKVSRWFPFFLPCSRELRCHNPLSKACYISAWFRLVEKRSRIATTMDFWNGVSEECSGAEHKASIYASFLSPQRIVKMTAIAWFAYTILMYAILIVM